MMPLFESDIANLPIVKPDRRTKVEPGQSALHPNKSISQRFGERRCDLRDYLHLA